MLRIWRYIICLSSVYLITLPAEAGTDISVPFFQAVKESLTTGLEGKILTFIAFTVMCVVFYYVSKIFINAYKRKHPYQEFDPSILGGNDKQRTWMRMGSEIDFYYTDKMEKLPFNKRDFNYSKMSNLSAGGFLFAAENPLAVGLTLRVVFWLDDGHNFDLLAITRRVFANPDDPSKPFNIGLEFLNIREGQRDAITKWIFSKQREQIVKEKVQDENEQATAPTDRICPICSLPFQGDEPVEQAICTRCKNFFELNNQLASRNK